MLESVSLSVVEAEADDTGPAHDFAGVGPEGVAESVLIALVVMPAEHSIGFAGFGEAPSDLGIVVEEDFPSVCFEFRDRIMQSDMRNFFAIWQRRNRSPSLLPKMASIGRSKPACQVIECERSTKIAEEKQSIALAGLNLDHHALEMIEPIVNVAKHGDEHRCKNERRLMRRQRPDQVKTPTARGHRSFRDSRGSWSSSVLAAEGSVDTLVFAHILFR